MAERYNQAKLIFGELEIVCDTFKTSFKKDTEELTACNSSSPYETTFGKKTVEAEASKVNPALRKQVQKLFDDDVVADLISYDYDENTGDLVTDDFLRGAYIKEISKDTANKPFDIKFGVRNKKEE